MVSEGVKIIQSVNARKGSKHVKNEMTTAASIKMTCLRYLMKLLRLPCPDIRLGLIIKCFAITEYRTIRINNGMRKNTDMLLKKKKEGQKLVTDVRHTGTCIKINKKVKKFVVEKEK